MLTTAALTGFKEHVKRTVAYAQYKVGSTYYRTEITKVYINSEGKVAIEFQVDHTLSGNITVTELRIYNTAGELWLSVSDNTTRKARQEGIFYRFAIDIKEA